MPSLCIPWAVSPRYLLDPQAAPSPSLFSTLSPPLSLPLPLPPPSFPLRAASLPLPIDLAIKHPTHARARARSWPHLLGAAQGRAGAGRVRCEICIQLPAAMRSTGLCRTGDCTSLAWPAVAGCSRHPGTNFFCTVRPDFLARPAGHSASSVRVCARMRANISISNPPLSIRWMPLRRRRRRRPYVDVA